MLQDGMSATATPLQRADARIFRAVCRVYAIKAKRVAESPRFIRLRVDNAERLRQALGRNSFQTMGPARIVKILGMEIMAQ